MSGSRLLAGLERLAGRRILCVGDVMLDHYVYGQVERVSPEAPIPILRVERETRTLGGAGNVVRNLQALGTAPCFLSVVGDDAAGRAVNRLVAADGAEAHLLVEKDRVTTVKTRYVAATQQMLRADRERVAAPGPVIRADLVRLAVQSIAEHAVVVLSDYGKGVLSQGLAGEIIAAARGVGRPVVLDPKGADYTPYRGAAIVKPNRRALAEASRMPVGSMAEIVAAARHLIAQCEFGAVLVSLSQDGMVLVEAGGAVHPIPATAREVYDVSGAGDTAIATLAAGLAAGMALADAAQLANLAAGIVVGKVGTAVTHASELREALLQGERGAAAKTQPLDRALDEVARWRHRGLRIGFTNGCFDILHPGHVSLLSQARAACDRLVVGLNSDASVARLKGSGRPVQDAAARAAVLASLASVDLVIVFAEETPMALIEAIRPDVLVKGADYTIDTVVGAGLVQSYGGRILLAELMDGHSTTATIRRMGAR